MAEQHATVALFEKDGVAFARITLPVVISGTSQDVVARVVSGSMGTEQLIAATKQMSNPPLLPSTPDTPNRDTITSDLLVAMNNVFPNLLTTDPDDYLEDIILDLLADVGADELCQAEITQTLVAFLAALLKKSRADKRKEETWY